MGDVIQIFKEPCECGIKGLRFKMLGRSDDMLIVKGINVHPTAVKNLVTKYYPRTTGEMRVMLHQPGPKVEPPIRLKIEYGGMVEDHKFLKDEIEQNIHDLLRFKAEVELVPEGTLERTSKKAKLVEKCY